MGDKILQIISRGLSIMSTTLSAAKGQMEPGSSQNALFNQIFIRLGDNNPRIKNKAEETLFAMAGHPSFGAQQVTYYITKAQNKKSNSLKHILGKMNLLNKILQKYSIKEHSISPSHCIEFGLFGLKHQNQDVRAGGFQVILQVYKAIGNKIRSHLTGLRQAQIDMLELSFTDIDKKGGKK